MKNWYEMLKQAMEDDGFDQKICTLTDSELKKEFNYDFSSPAGTYGKSFTAWGLEYVYFPVCYDGSEWIGWAPRNPCDISMDHQGGG